MIVSLMQASGVNLTFVSHMPQSRRTNVKFKNATRNLSLLVVLEIPTFGRGHAAMGAECRSRTTSEGTQFFFGVADNFGVSFSSNVTAILAFSHFFRLNAFE